MRLKNKLKARRFVKYCLKLRVFLTKRIDSDWFDLICKGGNCEEIFIYAYSIHVLDCICL
jgi:hypothetical protein